MATRPGLDAWIRTVLDAHRPGSAPAEVRRTSAGAELRLAGDVVVKLHAPRTDPDALQRRLDLAVSHRQFVPPLETRVRLAPDGRAVTVWPRVGSTDPDAVAQPWASAGVLLAGLHRVPAPDGLPGHGWPQRVTRAVGRAPAALRGLGERLLDQLAHTEPGRSAGVLHGDWHLGQLGRWTDGWRLLDVDDAGVGDPAWDLARPAGFWACGLLPDPDWQDFLDAYRDAGGPAVPAAGDPWPVLDLPARCAVFVAAQQNSHSPATADALVAACRRMAQ
ncbi:MAG: aminoglycoside phosphotransferase family protein [Micropruina sp.]|uniref:phosphotransferase family protein n=1 Tax=Micropruina sp. TaxID=2737536 RepID=UPI0039E4B056